jgi:hypothetical protein
MTNEQKTAYWKNRFANETACTEPLVDMVHINTYKDLFGNVTGAIYGFNCGPEKYACKIWSDQYGVRWFSKCTPKIAHSTARVK